MSVRVMTWNLWWRFGPWEARQPAIATVLRDEAPDLVCLQEVWAEDSGDDQAAMLADRLGFHHARTPAPYWNGMSLGNAILSRWPILGVESVRLPNLEGEPSHRSALMAVVDAPSGAIPVVSVHTEYRFDQSTTRVAQTSALAKFVKQQHDAGSFPVIIGGDLNAVADSDEIRQLTGRTSPPVEGLIFQDAWELVGEGPGHTWHDANPYVADSTWPNRRIDYVLVSWPRPKTLGTPIRAWIAGNRPVDGVHPSDHYAVVAELRAG